MAAHRSSIVFTLSGPIAPPDLPGLCGRVCELLEDSRAAVAYCDVGDAEADAVTVDALARLQLVARRNRCEMRLRAVSEELRELIVFMGVQDILLESDLLVE